MPAKQKVAGTMKASERRKPPIILAVSSDWHCGSTVALCPERVPLDDGGHYTASKLQLWTFQKWQQYWSHVESVRRQHCGEMYALINGDITDGDHHKTTQILSGNPTIQAEVVNAALKPLLALKPERLFVVRGTEVHVGNSAATEEGIAKGLVSSGHPVECDPDTGNAAWWHLRMELHGLLIDATHHGRTGQREHTYRNAINLYAHDILLSHIKSGDRPPDLCFRAHFHRFNDSYDACQTRVVQTGAWQHKTGYTHKKHADSVAHIGGAIVVIQSDGSYTVDKIHYKSERGAVWRPK